MKTTSIILTVLLILPITYLLFSAYNIHLAQNRFMHEDGIDFATLNTLSYILIELIFIAIAVFLNIKKKYLENSIMCATLLGSFSLSVLITSATSFLYTCLK